jgi:hypothetical protein
VIHCDKGIDINHLRERAAMAPEKLKLEN